MGSGCFLDQEVEPYYGGVVVPRAQEFRWSDGGLPQTFDPALAAAPPDTDVVRAMYEGLTDYDPKTLTPLPGVAARWESSPDGREWTFYLRRDARWSNGEPVTARDFARSWKRILELGENAPHARLLENIVNTRAQQSNPAATASPDVAPSPVQQRLNDKKEVKQENAKEAKPEPSPVSPSIGVEAVDDYTLRVRLQRPDVNFPALVAHPVFRPVHSSVASLSDTASAQRIVSNGPFQLSNSSNREGVVLERAQNYWDAQTVSLERVRFVPARDAESALAAYRAGEVDAVTNAGFEPLALKLLAPYKDFRRATFGALTYYSFNLASAPFNDVRVREALSIAVDRDRISEDEMNGATEPAKKFLPVQAQSTGSASNAQPAALERDTARARSLLAEAGFPQGKGFPVVRLLINRNEQQRVVAQSVAAMWQSVLGIETQIIMKSWDEYEQAVETGEYDVVRRGMVMQTTDEASNMRILFEHDGQTNLPQTTSGNEQGGESANKTATNGASAEKEASDAGRTNGKPNSVPVTSEAQALKELPAMPIYFASSYALVKPYVVGFDSNLLDAPSLKRVKIDTKWQQPKKQSAIWFKGNE